MSENNYTRICSIEGCEKNRESRGWCQKHYQRWRAHGNPLKTLTNNGKSLRERFEMKIEFRLASDCHWFTGFKDSSGYGQIRGPGKLLKAHRVAYELYVGSIPNGDGYHGMCVLHKCDNPSCINPDHLFLGTHQDNMDDKVNKNRHKIVI